MIFDCDNCYYETVRRQGSSGHDSRDDYSFLIEPLDLRFLSWCVLKTRNAGTAEVLIVLDVFRRVNCENMRLANQNLGFRRSADTSAYLKLLAFLNVLRYSRRVLNKSQISQPSFSRVIYSMYSIFCI